MEEIFNSSTTYQVILSLITIIITEIIKSDYNKKNLKNSVFRTINFIIPVIIIFWITIENKDNQTLSIYNILIVIFNFSLFLFNYFQSKISEQYKLLEKFSNEETNKVKEINHINQVQGEKMKAIVDNQNYILAELSKINDRIIGLYKTEK
jgi:hypothetical protein